MWKRIQSSPQCQLGLLVLLLGLPTADAHAGARPFPAQGAAIQPKPAPRVEVAFVLDTTGLAG